MCLRESLEVLYSWKLTVSYSESFITHTELNDFKIKCMHIYSTYITWEISKFTHINYLIKWSQKSCEVSEESLQILSEQGLFCTRPQSCKWKFLVQIPCWEDHVAFPRAADWTKKGASTQRAARNLCCGLMWKDEQDQLGHFSWGCELWNGVAGVKVEEERSPWDMAGPCGLLEIQNRGEDKVVSQTEVRTQKRENH